MVQRAIQHCCKSRSSREPIASHIWISDDVLTTQWTIFTRSTQRYSTIHSRQFSSATTSQRKSDSLRDSTRHNTRQIIQNEGTIYQTRRHGSAVPGPLEARRRRALRKHMTGDSNLGMFGSGLDFSGTPWRGGFGRVGESPNTRGNSLYDAMGMIWRWWLLDPDAPTRQEEITAPTTQEHVRADSFADLLQSLDITWLQKPKAIEDLLTILLATKADQPVLLQKACFWIRAEINLGAMAESTIKSILRNLSRVGLQPHETAAVDTSQRLFICQSIAESILTSSIRPLKELDQDTTWLLLRSLVLIGSHHSQSIDCVSNILQSVALEQPKLAAQMLTMILEMKISKPGCISETYFSNLLGSLPTSMSCTGVTSLAMSLIRACKTKQGFSNARKLGTFLEELSRSSLLVHLQVEPSSNVQWLQVEYELSKLDISFAAAYLQALSEANVCSYILKHVVRNSSPWVVHSGKRKDNGHVLCMFQSLPIDQQTYHGLLHVVEESCPLRMRATLQFVYRFFRMTDRMSECYNMNRYLFSRKDLRGRLSFEFFQNEVTLWAEKYPLFAVLLLATDRRRGIMHHAVVAKTLAAISSEFDQIPADLMSKLANTLIETHGENLKVSCLQGHASNNSTRVLQLLLDPVSWGQCDEQRAFGIAKRILELLGPVSEALRQESSMAITNIVAIKTLEARCRVANWKLEWLAGVVIQLEGPDVWGDTLRRIEQWWRVIETEEESNGRKWKHGVGWVSK